MKLQATLIMPFPAWTVRPSVVFALLVVVFSMSVKRSSGEGSFSPDEGTLLSVEVSTEPEEIEPGCIGIVTDVCCDDDAEVDGVLFSVSFVVVVVVAAVVEVTGVDDAVGDDRVGVDLVVVVVVVGSGQSSSNMASH